jgi:ribonuclease HII
MTNAGITPTASLSYEYALRAQGFHAVAGLDEAGRGAWAGPVAAGAVILPLDRFDLAHLLQGVTDSKQLSPVQREVYLPRIMAVATAVGFGYATHQEIDDIGIVPATHLAMRRALSHLSTQPDALLIDALRLPEVALPCTALTKGDQKSLSIAAASIVAKVIRDQFMDQMDEYYPQYGFLVHKGYGTPLHQHALRQFGPTDIHRRSFAPIQALLNEHPGEESTS